MKNIILTIFCASVLFMAMLIGVKTIVHAEDRKAAIKRSTYKDTTTGMEFVLVKGGCYQMGDTFGDGDNDEKPVHEVCVDDYYIGKFKVTQGQWKKVMGNNPYTPPYQVPPI